MPKLLALEAPYVVAITLVQAKVLNTPKCEKNCTTLALSFCALPSASRGRFMPPALKVAASLPPSCVRWLWPPVFTAAASCTNKQSAARQRKGNVRTPSLAALPPQTSCHESRGPNAKLHPAAWCNSLPPGTPRPASETGLPNAAWRNMLQDTTNARNCARTWRGSHK